MATKEELLDLLAVKLKLFFHDNFFTMDKILSSETGTGYVDWDMTSLQLQTGIQANSTAQIYYDAQIFNPKYADLYIKLRMNSYENLEAFFGFMGTTDTPGHTMTTSHAGIYVYQGKVYWTTGTELEGRDAYKNTVIEGLDVRRFLVYHVQNYNFKWFSLPYVEPYFDGFQLPGLQASAFRKWSQVYSNGSVQPEDKVHYIVAWIKNLTNENKVLEIQRMTYAEEYADW